MRDVQIPPFRLIERDRALSISSAIQRIEALEDALRQKPPPGGFVGARFALEKLNSRDASVLGRAQR